MSQSLHLTRSEPKSWQRNLVGNGWSIVEAQSFEAGVAACGGYSFIEEIIAPVKLGLHRNPKQFIETARPGIYLAKTKTHWKGADIVLGYSIWFRVIEQALTVELLYIEMTNPDFWNGDESDEIPW
ncbi:MAG: hypothetical protein U1E58_05105 [Tabrizicola sp.]